MTTRHGRNLLARIAASALIAFAGAGVAFGTEFNQVALDKSRVSFVSKQMNVPVEGGFKKFSAQVAFDPAKAEAGKAQVEIDTASIDTGSQEANDEVVSKNWFNVKAYPTAKFVSTGVKPLGNNRYEVAGKLTIKDTTRDVVAPVTFKPEGGNANFEGAITIKRLDYKIGEGVWSDTDTVADEVQVRFKLLVTAGARK